MAATKNQEVKKAKLALQGKVIFKPEPSIEDLFNLFLYPKIQSNIDKNDSIYVTWLQKVLNDYNSKNVLCLHMNSSNNNRLHDFINPMTYLNYSPVDNDDLENDELMIDLNKAQENE